MIYKDPADIKAGDVYLFSGRDYFLDGKLVRIVEPGEYAEEGELTVELADGTRSGLAADGEADVWYVQPSELTELEQQDDQWEWGVALRGDLVDLHRTHMSERAAREFVAEFEANGGRRNAFQVVKRPIGKWEVA